MPDEISKKKPARKGNGKAASATRAARAEEIITFVTDGPMPSSRRTKYDWAALAAGPVGGRLIVAGATTKRQLAVPETLGIKVGQTVQPDGLHIVRIA